MPSAAPIWLAPACFGCGGCRHGRAYSHKLRLIEACAACGKQHSLLAGTIFAQTKTGLARWFLAIYLVTSSKGSIAAMEPKRQLGFGSYQLRLELAARDQEGHGPAGARAAERARGG